MTILDSGADAGDSNAVRLIPITVLVSLSVSVSVSLSVSLSVSVVPVMFLGFHSPLNYFDVPAR